MPFKVLKIGNGSRIPVLRYSTNPKRTHLTIYVPLTEAKPAGLTAGDAVQFQVGDGEHAGCFGIGKGKTDARKLTGGTINLVLRIPLLPPIQKHFPDKRGNLRKISSDPKGALVFSVA